MDKLFVAMQLGFNICFLGALLALARGTAAEPAVSPRRERRRRLRREPSPARETTETTAPAPPAPADDLEAMVSDAERRETTINRPAGSPAPVRTGGGPSAPAVAELQARIARFRRIRGGDGADHPEDPAGPASLSGSGSRFSRPNPRRGRGTRLARVTGTNGR